MMRWTDVDAEVKRQDAKWKAENEEIAEESESLYDLDPMLGEIIFDEYAERELRRLEWKRNMIIGGKARR